MYGQCLVANSKKQQYFSKTMLLFDNANAIKSKFLSDDTRTHPNNCHIYVKVDDTYQVDNVMC